MTITRILYFLVSYNVQWTVIQAIQPDGYLGCFLDLNGESLKNIVYYTYNRNEGKLCKEKCNNEDKRYAGTKYKRCYCGTDVVKNIKRNASECDLDCPGNTNERCGGSYYSTYNRISLYDTWLCITSPCQNGATCTDIDADNYNCSCSVGWTGRVCNETVTTTTTTLFPSSSTQHIGSTITTETVTTTTSTIFSSSSTEPILILTTARNFNATTYSLSPSSSRQDIGSSTVVGQPSENKSTIYIAVPVSIAVLIVFVLIVTFLILRKKLSQNKDNQKAVYQNTAKTGHSLLAVANNAYNDNDIIPLETTVNVNATEDKNEDAATSDSIHNYYTLEETGNGNSNYNNVDQRSGSAIHFDDNGYGHLHVRSTALCDPTYSYTTTTGPQGTTDNTYSHIDLSVGNARHEVMSYVDQDTYNTRNINGDVGKLRPVGEITDTDDTYNRLAISGKVKNIGEKHTVSCVNEPDYDHTEVRNH